jgi:hypothetical protein
MRLYMAVPTDYAVEVVSNGFTHGRPLYDPETDEISTTAFQPYLDFRDLAPTGASFGVTAEGAFQEPTEDDDFQIAIQGPVMFDDPGAFVLSIEVPDEFALQQEARFEPPVRWAFREFWLQPEEANLYIDTLKIYDSDDGEEVRPDLVGK